MSVTIKQDAMPSLAADDASATVRTTGRAGRADYPFLRPPVEADEIGRLGNYRVLKLLGQGGMGYVFLAEDADLRRPVALKVMKPDHDPDDTGCERFLREARLMASIKHEHVVTVFQVGQEGRAPYLAMELLHGKSLADWMKRAPRVGGPVLIRLGRQIAAGMAVIHGHGLIHRDIKPANVWLEAPRGRVKILDFGLARVAEDDARLTQTGTVVGTPSYMSPEQARGEALDPRSDLFSLGSLLYELAAGARPFEAPTTMGVLTALALNDPTPLHRLRPDLPEDYSDLVMQLLAKDPARRPASAEEVVARLQKIDGRAATRVIPPVSPSDTHCVAPPAPPTKKAKTRKTGAKRRRRMKVILAVALPIAAVLAVLAGAGAALLTPGGKAGAPATPPAYLTDLKPADDNNPISKPPAPPGQPAPPPFPGVTVLGRLSPHGIFMHPPLLPGGGEASVRYKLSGQYGSFTAETSLNDGPPECDTPLTFSVLGDGRLLWQSHPVRRQADADHCSVSVKGVDMLTIRVSCPGSPRGAHAVWVEPKLAP